MLAVPGAIVVTTPLGAIVATSEGVADQVTAMPFKGLPLASSTAALARTESPVTTLAALSVT